VRVGVGLYLGAGAGAGFGAVSGVGVGTVGVGTVMGGGSSPSADCGSKAARRRASSGPTRSARRLLCRVAVIGAL
jgi:hypothetical protein